MHWVCPHWIFLNAEKDLVDRDSPIAVQEALYFITRFGVICIGHLISPLLRNTYSLTSGEAIVKEKPNLLQRKREAMSFPAYLTLNQSNFYLFTCKLSLLSVSKFTPTL